MMRMIWEVLMPRVKVNLTLEADLVEAARGLGLNMSRIAETAIAETVKAERNRLWRRKSRGHAKLCRRDGARSFEGRSA